MNQLWTQQIDPADLPDDALMASLWACEHRAAQRGSRRVPHMRYGSTPSEIKAGRALIAEAWYRGLISAPKQEATDAGH